MSYKTFENITKERLLLKCPLIIRIQDAELLHREDKRKWINLLRTSVFSFLSETRKEAWNVYWEKNPGKTNLVFEISERGYTKKVSKMTLSPLPEFEKNLPHYPFYGFVAFEIRGADENTIVYRGNPPERLYFMKTYTRGIIPLESNAKGLRSLFKELSFDEFEDIYYVVLSGGLVDREAKRFLPRPTLAHQKNIDQRLNHTMFKWAMGATGSTKNILSILEEVKPVFALLSVEGEEIENQAEDILRGCLDFPHVKKLLKLREGILEKEENFFLCFKEALDYHNRGRKIITVEAQLDITKRMIQVF